MTEAQYARAWVKLRRKETRPPVPSTKTKVEPDTLEARVLAFLNKYPRRPEYLAEEIARNLKTHPAATKAALDRLRKKGRVTSSRFRVNKESIIGWRAVE